MPTRKKAPAPVRVAAKPKAAPVATTDDISTLFDAARDALLDLHEKHEKAFVAMMEYEGQPSTVNIGIRKLIAAFSDKTLQARIKKQHKQMTLEAAVK